MNKIFLLKKYLSKVGFSHELDTLNSLIKEASQDYIRVYNNLLAMLKKHFSDLNIEESNIEDKHIRITAKRFFNLEIMEGSEISCEQNLLIRISGPTEGQHNLTYFVKSELTGFGTLFGDFKSTMSESATEEERRLSRSGIERNIKDMINELTSRQHSELMNFGFEELDS